MSDACPAREWRFYVEDMVTFCDKVASFTQGLDGVSFAADVMRYDATLSAMAMVTSPTSTTPTA